jgi:hypothetical protein
MLPWNGGARWPRCGHVGRLVGWRGALALIGAHLNRASLTLSSLTGGCVGRDGTTSQRSRFESRTAAAMTGSQFITTPA